MITTLNELGEKYGYSTKTYNLLAIILILKNDSERAMKIFESAISDLKLSQPEGEQTHLYPGNNDLGTLLYNYIKCSAMRQGCGNDSEFFKTDDHFKNLFGYLTKVNPALASTFFDERKEAEKMFDDAVKTVM